MSFEHDVDVEVDHFLERIDRHLERSGLSTQQGAAILGQRVGMDFADAYMDWVAAGDE